MKRVEIAVTCDECGEFQPCNIKTTIPAEDDVNVASVIVTMVGSMACPFQQEHYTGTKLSTDWKHV